MATTFRERVLLRVAMIPEGQVTTYGLIAEQLGNPRCARLVGGVLSRTEDAHLYPCHRVVNRDGVLTGGWAFGHPDIMRQLLLDEHVPFRLNGTVDLDRCLWDPQD